MHFRFTMAFLLTLIALSSPCPPVAFGASTAPLERAVGPEALVRLEQEGAMSVRALGTLTAWGVVQGLLRMQFLPDLTMGFLTVLAGVLVSLVMGLLGTWRVLGRKAAPFLRNE